MANQVAARLAGDDYQHLYSWYVALELLKENSHIQEIKVEDEDAGSFDDVTVKFASERKSPDYFYQIKFHVDKSNAYSTDIFLAKKKNGTSLLQKMYSSWAKVSGEAKSGSAQFMFFSNWGWDPADAIGSCISGHDGTLSRGFLEATPRSDVGKMRRRWEDHLGVSSDDFGRFISSIRFAFGSTDASSLARLVSERMEYRGLRSDEVALKTAAGIVREWITKKEKVVTRSILSSAIDKHALRTVATERAVTVHIETIRKRRFDLTPDYLLDWRHYFEGPDDLKDHQTVDPSLWNEVLLPQLYALERQVNESHQASLIRARGLSRLSVWFCLGYVFSSVAGYSIEVAQGSSFWRSDASPSDLRLVSSMQHSVGTKTLAIGLSVTGNLETDVKHYLNDNSIASSTLFIAPEGGPSPTILRNAGDAVAVTQKAKELIRDAIDDLRPEIVLLFLFGPLSVACFLGHRLNAIGAPIQIMEQLPPSYARSFLLK